MLPKFALPTSNFPSSACCLRCGKARTERSKCSPAEPQSNVLWGRSLLGGLPVGPTSRCGTTMRAWRKPGYDCLGKSELINRRGICAWENAPEPEATAVLCRGQIQGDARYDGWEVALSWQYLE